MSNDTHAGDHATTDTADRGPIAWMAQHNVASNLLMIVLLVGGFLTALRIKQEVFPEFDLDLVTISVPYPGASPEEVENGIILAIEEEIRGIDGIEEITATASEGAGTVVAELIADADRQEVYQNIKQQVDRITTFPEDAEEPRVELSVRRRAVLDTVLTGQVDNQVLYELAEQVRDRLLQESNITQIDIFPARQYEVSIEIPIEHLRRYRLTLEDVAERIRRAAVELPAGSVETRSGEILLRVTERRDYARQFARLPIVTTPDGTRLLLEDIATVTDTFEDTDLIQTYNGLPSVTLQVYRIGNQTPIGVSDTIRDALPRIEVDLPPGIDVAVLNDRSDIYRQRLELLLRNGLIGLALVFTLLGLFLEIRLAFWVMMGIPISFLGAILFLPVLGVSINMISMFAFIIALGIVVDDAIVAGENIYAYRQAGYPPVQAAIKGARSVAVPITFAILTNIVAFMPLWFVPGFIGKVFGLIPAVVVAAFIISLVEALFILPAHLAHARQAGRTSLGSKIHHQQQRLSNAFTRFADYRYKPFIDACLRHRYITLAVAVCILTVTVGFIASGRMGLQLMPRVESDSAFASARLPYGSPVESAMLVRDQLVESFDKVARQNGGDQLVVGVLTTINENEVEVRASLTEPDIRPISTTQVTNQWREHTGAIPGLESLRFESDRGGPGGGAALTVELGHRKVEVLDRASQDLAAKLVEFPETKDIDDGYTPGKQQLDFRMRDEGRSMGLTSYMVARQLRSAFYGAEALRQQRGRNEVKVMVRLPESQRVRLSDIEQLMIRTPSGPDVPLMEVADVTSGRAFTTITRRDGRRTVNVTSDVVPRSRTEQILRALKTDVLPELVRRYPGLTYGFEGRQADLRESLRALNIGFIMAMLGIFALLAMPFRSYIQPLIVMTAIPFSIVGAVLGHLIMGYSLSIISLMGVVALAGVAVNDALVLIVYANEQRKSGMTALEAIATAGARRFRPILLTTLTTFGGLAPMIFETSRQARFLIPMALSLGFGIIFATFITLIVVPCLYMMIEDVWHVLKPQKSSS